MNTNKSKSEERLTKTMQRHDWYSDVCQVIAEQVILLLDQVSPPYSTTFYRCAQMRSSMPHRIEALLHSASPAIKDALFEYFDEVIWPRVRNEQCDNPLATYRLTPFGDDIVMKGGHNHD